MNGVELAYFERAGKGPTIFFAHATGFHARCWDRVIERLPGRHAIAVDMRGHGRSEKVPPPYRWSLFGEDVAALADYLGLRGGIGVGHSKGGAAVTRAAGLRPGTFAALLLVDPVLMAPEAYRANPEIGEHFAARRRNAWSSPEEMFERFKDRPPFASWDPEVLRDYCDYGLLPAAEGEGYVLACPPQIEAAIYAGSAGSDPYDLIPGIDIPVRVLRARQRQRGETFDMSGSPTWPRLAEQFPQGEDVPVPQYTHFIPMEDPVFIAAQVEEMVGKVGE
ncbi:MAG: alpha/beta hydrolase [Dehalococcoidia bacterium]